MESRLGLLLRRHPRRSRIIAWSLLPAIVLPYVWARASTSSQADTIHSLLFLVPVALATLGSALAWVDSDRATITRTAWGGMTVAIGLLFAGAIYYAAYQVIVSMEGPPAPSAFDVLNLAAAIALVGLLNFMTGVRYETILARVQVAAVAGVFVVAVHAVLYRWFSAPIAAASGHSGAEASLWAWYSTVGTLLVVGCAVVFYRDRRTAWAPWRLYALVSILGFGFGVFLWPTSFMTPAPDSASDIVLSVAYIVGYFLFFMSGVSWLTSESRASLPRTSIVTRGSVGARTGLAVTSFALLALPLLALSFFTAEVGTFDRFLYFGGLVLTTILVVLRTALSDYEAMGLRKSATVDPLTSVANRGAFDDMLNEGIQWARAHNSRVSLAVVDIDDFARFNVVNGTVQGDAALAALARCLRDHAGIDGSVARLGGDEFALILKGLSNSDASARVSEILRQSEPISRGGESPALSAGVSSWPEDGETADDVLAAADAALYWAKYQGKHRVQVYDDVVVRALAAEERVSAYEQKSRTDIVRALAAATDARDSATAYHSRQVAALAFLVAEAVGLGSGRARDVQMAALLHDIGKVAVPDSVLRKRSRLSWAEREVLMEHADVGARILGATELANMAPWVRAHHEQWDGGGYPDGMAGPAIPLEARIIAACDLYDQMVSGTPERGPLSHSAAIQELDQSMNRALDPDVAEALIEVVSQHRSIGWSEAWLT